ncbi:MAG: translation initiation factor [Chitinophagaceae bacterium]|jgi:translation initiation factor 1|nr:translation initiation factor [Chitinophagaceae bacterium]
MSKNKSGKGGIVYSTDPNFQLPGQKKLLSETLPAAKQKLHILLDRKQRAGKSVTLIYGFSGTDEDLEDLGKKIKTFCGTGGSVKNFEILIQGDQRDKVLSWLHKNGYTSSKKI